MILDLTVETAQGGEDRDLGQEVGHPNDVGGVEVGRHADHTIGKQLTFNFVTIQNHYFQVMATT